MALENRNYVNVSSKSIPLGLSIWNLNTNRNLSYERGNNPSECVFLSCHQRSLPVKVSASGRQVAWLGVALLGCPGKPPCRGMCSGCPCQCCHGGAGVGSGDSSRDPTRPSLRKRRQPRPPPLQSQRALGPVPGMVHPPPAPRFFPFVGRRVRPRGKPLLPPAPRRKGCSSHLLPSASQGISACFFFPAVSYSFSPGKPEECFALQTAERWGGKDNIQGLKKLTIAWRISLKNYSEIFCSSLIEVNKVQ